MLNVLVPATAQLLLPLSRSGFISLMAVLFFQLEKTEKILQNLTYNRTLKTHYPPPDNLKVFGTFVGGGGSTMGYKLAGFHHL